MKSERLRQIAACVKMNIPAADIGTDHAKLPCYLVSRGIVPLAIAVEVNRGPFEAAKRRVREQGLNGQVDVRFGDGLTVIEPGEAGTIVIAGLGGKLGTAILSRGHRVAAKAERLVLQPNGAARQLRQWMMKCGWQLTDERLIEENGHYYDILVAEQGDPYRPYEAVQDGASLGTLLEVGPFLWQRKHPLLRGKLEQDLRKWRRILKQMQHIREVQALKKREKLEDRIRIWEEMIACLPREKTSSAFLSN